MLFAWMRWKIYVPKIGLLFLPISIERCKKMDTSIYHLKSLKKQMRAKSGKPIKGHTRLTFLLSMEKIQAKVYTITIPPGCKLRPLFSRPGLN